MPSVKGNQKAAVLLTNHTIPWLENVLAAAGFSAVIFGFFEPDFPKPQYTVVLTSFIILATLFEAIQILRGKHSEGLLETIPGLLLWTVSIWILYRLAFPSIPQILLLSAGYVAWLILSYPFKICIAPLVAILIMETGLTLNNHQPASFLFNNLILFGAATFSLQIFTSSKMYHRYIKKAKDKEDEETEEYVKDFDLFSLRTSVQETLPPKDNLEKPGGVGREIRKSLSSSFQVHLEILKNTLKLTTAALLWPDSQRSEFKLRSFASSRKDIFLGPYPMGSGIIGVIRRAENEIAIVPVKAGGAMIPYYHKQGKVGGLFALQIEKSANNNDQDEITAILCVDRLSDNEWTETEKAILRMTAKKITHDVMMGRRILSMDQDRNAFQKVCIGLRELNAVLGLETVFDTTIKVVKTLVPSDFIAISMLRDKSHFVVRADGKLAGKITGQEFPLHEGMVGQAIKYNRTLPMAIEYRGPAPIFTYTQRFSDFGSILVLPLRKEKGGLLGALTVAAKESGIFTTARREILELIAAQIAIKIDLGEAHEQINKLATTDGLTNLANHRTFQHGFEMMLHRARRQSTSVCLILCDLDHFKRINDTYGHPFGDDVLRAVANVLANAVRKVDLAARYGGEEFALVLEGSNESGGITMAERIRKEVHALSLQHEGEPVHLTMSLGLAVFPDNSDDKPTLINYADQALYKAKNSGRNQTTAWSTLDQ